MHVIFYLNLTKPIQLIKKLLHVVIIKVFVLYFVRLFYKIFGYIKEHLEQIPCEIIMFCDLSKMVILRSGFVRRRAWSKAKLVPLYIFFFWTLHA